MTEDQLRKLERATFRATSDTGLWDIYLASIISMLAIGPYLSVYVGDFWAAAVFLPVFALLLWGMHLVKVRVIEPRLGVVEYGRTRQKKLQRLGGIMLAVNLIALVLGLAAWFWFPMEQGHLVPLVLSLVLLLGASAAAFFLEIPRVFLYGLLLAAAPPIGEFLFQRGYATHHGFGVTFGTCAVVILVAGGVRFIRFLPPASPHPGPSSAEGIHE